MFRIVFGIALSACILSAQLQTVNNESMATARTKINANFTYLSGHLRGFDVCPDTPTDAQRLTWSAADSCWKPAGPAPMIDGHLITLPLGSALSTGSVSSSANQMRAWGLYDVPDMIVSNAALDVTTPGTAAATVRLCLFIRAGNTATLVRDLGTAAADTIGVKLFSFTGYPLDATKAYVIGMASNETAVQVRTASSTSTSQYMAVANAGASNQTFGTVTGWTNGGACQESGTIAGGNVQPALVKLW